MVESKRCGTETHCIDIVCVIVLSDSDARSSFYSLIKKLFLYFLCASYRPSQVSYSVRRLTAFQTQNLYVGPQPESELYHTKTPLLNPLFPGAEAKPDPIKGGLRVTSFFTYNCLAVSLSETLEKH